MSKIKMVKVLFDNDIGDNIIEKVKDTTINWRPPNDYHITCVFYHINEVDREDKIEVIQKAKELIDNKQDKIDITFEGVYQSEGTLFTKVKETSIELPYPSDQILHMTLKVDFDNNHKPKESLFSLKDGTYNKILEFDETYTGQLVIEEILN